MHYPLLKYLQIEEIILTINFNLCQLIHYICLRIPSGFTDIISSPSDFIIPQYFSMAAASLQFH